MRMSVCGKIMGTGTMFGWHGNLNGNGIEICDNRKE